jgi:hypothetical protein
MTIPKTIFDFLKKNRKQTFCDDCIAKELGLAQRQQAQQVTSTLALTGEFSRK